YVPQDDRRRNRVVVAKPDVGLADTILAGNPAERLEKVVLGQADRKIQREGTANGRRNDLVNQRVERRGADDGEHSPDVLAPRSDVAQLERIVRLVCHFTRLS